MAEIAARWLAIYVPTSRTGKNVGMAAQRVRDFLNPYMGEKPLCDVGADDLRLYRQWLEGRKLAPRTVRHLLADARCLLSWSVESGYLDRSPFPRRLMPRIQERAPDLLLVDVCLSLYSFRNGAAGVMRPSGKSVDDGQH